ncbi:monooxygenase family protein [Streptomyces lydicus]|uniref:monooxygenase family protein n=1 Tax=Streptomyces lydicus TaxID=47763 RepID=UPI0037B52F3F
MSGKPVQGRMTADGTGEVVVFLIGMRVNSWRAVRSWLPVFRVMPRMIKELAGDRESGMLGYRLQGRGKVGFWHETFVVPAGSFESIYVNMPAYGLGEARGVVPVGRRGERAADRLAA